VRGYVLTERGKILVAMLVVLFLIIPSVIIFIYTSSQNTHHDESPDVSNNIHQNGTEPASSEHTSETASPPDETQALSNESSADSVSLDIEAGRMTFLFAPETQAAIDDNTSSMIGQLLASPKNTDDSKIAVEIPQLTDDETAKLTTIILNAFISHGIQLSDIVFFVYLPESDEAPFEIKISFS